MNESKEAVSKRMEPNKLGILSRGELLPSPYSTKTKTPWPLVHKRIKPTERQLFVGEVDTNFCGLRGVAVGLGFLDRSRYFFIQAAPHLSSQGLSEPHSRPTTSQKIW
jgi:hypothetical protein